MLGSIPHLYLGPNLHPEKVVQIPVDHRVLGVLVELQFETQLQILPQQRKSLAHYLQLLPVKMSQKEGENCKQATHPGAPPVGHVLRNMASLRTLPLCERERFPVKHIRGLGYGAGLGPASGLLRNPPFRLH